MKVLVACEFSGIVRDAFASLGHDAWSCDLLPTERPGNHIQGDVRKHLYEGWDLMIAHPPCTYLSNAGQHYWKDPHRRSLRNQAMEFFNELWECAIPKICIENPTGWPNKTLGPPQQTVNPFDFGEFERKRICLWLKNIPPLMLGPLAVVQPKGSCVKANGRKYNYYFHQGKSGHARSRFFPGIADAMAKQWGGLEPQPRLAEAELPLDK